MDETGSKLIFKSALGRDYISAFDVTSDGNYILVGLNSEIKVYQFINPLNQLNLPQQFIQVGQCNFPTQVEDLIYVKDIKIAVAVGMLGSVVVYDVEVMSEVYILSTYTVDTLQITGVSVSDDGHWIYLACDIVGVVVLKINIIPPQIPNDKRQATLLNAATGVGYRKSWYATATHDQQILFEVEMWFGLFYAPFKNVLASSESQYPLKLNFTGFWPFSQISPTTYILLISSNDNLLFVAARSQGIFIFDISQRDNFRFYHQIQVDALAQSGVFSRTEQYLYYSNSISVYTFVQNKPNLNNQYPNIFNTNQAIELSMDGIYKWRCYVDPTDNYLIGAFDYSGFYIMPFYQDPYKLNLDTSIRLSIESDSAYLDPDGKYLYIPSLYSENLLTVLQIKPDSTDPTNSQNISIMNPKIVYSYHTDTVQMSESIKFSKDRQYATITHSTGILIFNTTNPLDFKLIKYWENPSFISGENQGAVITHDNKWIVSTVRAYGIYALSFTDKNNITLVDYIETLGGEGIELSILTDQYAYLMDGMLGFAIIDLYSLPKIDIISRVSLPGWTSMIQPLFDEQYMLVGQMEKGMLSLLTIKDKINPRKISAYQRDKQYCVSICIPNDQSFVFIAGPQGIISLPLTSKVMIHTEVSQLISNGSTNTTQKFDQKLSLVNTTGLSQDDFVFSVGQIIQLNFVILYPQDNMKITSLHIYQNDQVLDLPYFMSYNPSTQTLVMAISQQLLQNIAGGVALNTILVETVIPLSTNNFIYDADDADDLAVTNSDQAQFIINYLQHQGIINDKYTLNSGFNPNNYQIFDDNFLKGQILTNVTSKDYQKASQQFIKKVIITLIQSQFVNSVIYYVRPSLFFYYQSSSPSIQTLSDQVVIEIQSNVNDGIFVQQIYQGVISSTSSTFNYLRLSGQLNLVNNILQNKIIFANKTVIHMDDQINNSTQMLNITISDSINFPIAYILPLNRCNFITLKQQIQENPNSTLQQQINRLFSNSEVAIEEDLSIIFADNTFQTSDAQTITYTTMYTKGDVDNEEGYKKLTQDFWLQQEGSTKLSFHGTVPTDSYLEVFSFKVNATDGYTYKISKFQIKIYAIPFSYIFNLLLKILGPFFAIIGIYQKRCIILNMIFKNSVHFDEEIVECNQKYVKKIIMLGDSHQDSKIIVNLLFAKIEQEQSKKKNVQKQEEINHTNPSMIDEGHPYCNDQQLDENNIIKMVQQTKLMTTNKPPKVVNIKKTKNQLSAFKSQQKTHPAEKLYLKQDGSMSMSKIIKDIISFNLMKVRQINQNNIADLKNVNSRLYRGIRSHAARYLLQLDKKSQLVYEFIKSYCYEYLQKSLNDWYKALVNLDYKQETDDKGILTIFPQLSINVQNLIKIIFQINILSIEEMSQINNFTQLIKHSTNKQLDINFFLIREVLYADALGYCSHIPSVLQPSVGESIHLHSYEILQIIAFKKEQYKNSCVRFLMSMLNLDYNKYGVSKNLRLPKWLQLDQKHGILMIYGTPSTEDIDEVLIRVYDLSGYVIKQFSLKVQASEKQKFVKDESLFSIPDESDSLFQLDQVLDDNQQLSQNCTFNIQQISPIYNKRERQKTYKSIYKNSTDFSPQKQANETFNSDTFFFQQQHILKSKTKDPVSIQLYEFQKRDNSKNSFIKHNETISFSHQNSLFPFKTNNDLISLNYQETINETQITNQDTLYKEK
ncbi:calpain family cysteine protease (macronuclear) [Tetrahymena thermophila SB210]|uniref:Calpain family cysteine protease n=1 Tax=Tetrahymena thermophila (strain SB210) TaxID=312017 RepID=I7LZQ8_TETTS|nr:calpain family cysteine protease [Tetrahymena thermophila SB210]EAR84636.2 calpain family cysteine protease [Tetrahymena thermophila SB210]|eukprot:XP_001032299.2 calpain family cysteine protease [Tetrahymena thermophila SB210]